MSVKQWSIHGDQPLRYKRHAGALWMKVTWQNGSILAANRLPLNLMWMHQWHQKIHSTKVDAWIFWMAWMMFDQQTKTVWVNQGRPSPSPSPSSLFRSPSTFLLFEWGNQEIKPGGEELEKGVCCFSQAHLLLLLVGGVWVEEQTRRDSFGFYFYFLFLFLLCFVSGVLCRCLCLYWLNLMKMSNVQSFISNDFLIKGRSQHGRVESPMKKVHFCLFISVCHILLIKMFWLWGRRAPRQSLSELLTPVGS